MPDIIQLLPDSIANQIAAGEVVQRPASAVKELLENAIDAGAREVTLLVKDGGKVLIQIFDNGSGMSETDARLSLERHATSKIKSIHDLLTLQTMGFRGEALASIAAVSQMEIRTRLSDKELGTLLVVEASEVKKQEPVACTAGTSISIKNLFFNIPARRNFLKSNPVEARHITEEFLRVALANPRVSFTFRQGDELTYDFPACDLAHRVIQVFGKSYKEQMASCMEETSYVQVHGFVGKPEFSKRTRGEQYIFVNNRFIRSNYLHHAVMNAFEGLLAEGSFPFYVLFITIDPTHIDVNIHPTKTEIKFDDDRAVYAVVRAAVRQTVAANHLTPTLDFSDDINLISKMESNTESKNDVYLDERFHVPREKSNVRNWSNLFVPEIRQSAVKPLHFESAINTDAGKGEPEKQKGFIVQLHNRYILCEVRQGMMLVDQHLAHERILYEQYTSQLKNNAGQSQQTLFPTTLSFNSRDFAMIMEMEREINALGFQFEIFGKNALIINGVPSGTETGNEKNLFEGLIEQFKFNQDTLSVPVGDNLARAMAKRAAIRRGKPLTREEMESLTGRLMSCNSPAYTPDGTPTFHIFDLARLEQFMSPNFKIK